MAEVTSFNKQILALQIAHDLIDLRLQRQHMSRSSNNTGGERTVLMAMNGYRRSCTQSVSDEAAKLAAFNLDRLGWISHSKSLQSMGLHNG